MKKVSTVAIAVLFALAVVTPIASAQLTTSQSISVTVNVQVNSSISLVESGGSLNFDPVTGKTNNITLTAQWNLGPTNNVTLYSWFSNPASALSTGSTNIPSSVVSATAQSGLAQGGIGGASGLPCNQTPGVGNGVVDGAACQPVLLGNVSAGNVNPGGPSTGSVITTYSLALLNYSSLKLPAGNFSGVINFLVLSV